VLVGEGPVLVQCVEILLDAGHEIVAVFCADPVAGRELARRSVTVYSPERNLDAALAVLEFDWLFSVVNPRILSARALAMPRKGAINYHDSPLPRYAGLNATSWALLAGETSHAVTWHAITPGIDDGDILKQVAVSIQEGDTALSLNVRCATAALAGFRELVAELANDSVTRRAQDLSGRSYFGRNERPVGAALLRPSRPARELDATVRALAFGPTHNPLASAKLVWNGEVLLVGGSRSVPPTGAAPGTIVRVHEGKVQLATADGDLALGPLTTQLGRELTNDELNARFERGRFVEDVTPALFEEVTEVNGSVSRHEGWWTRRLRDLVPPPLSWATVVATDPAVDTLEAPLPVDVASALTGDAGGSLLAALGTVLGQLGGSSELDIAWSDSRNPSTSVALELFARFVPVRVRAARGASIAETRAVAAEALEQTRGHGTYALDVFARVPDLRPLAGDPPLPVAVGFGTTPVHAPGSGVTVQVLSDEHRWRWSFDSSRIDKGQVRSLLDAVARVLLAPAGVRVRDVQLLDTSELDDVVRRFNSVPAAPVDGRALHAQFSEVAARTPDAVAVDDGTLVLTYAELDRRSNQLAHFLVRRGVRREQRVGVWTTRSSTWVMSMLAVAKAGAVYCPLEEKDPPARAQSILRDSRAVLLLTAGVATELEGLEIDIVDLGRADSLAAIAQEPVSAPDVPFDPQQLAYVIYTSGTTGKPNGVAVEHRQLAAFTAEHIRFVGLSGADRVSPMASPAFGASIPGVWPTIVSGAGLYPVPDDLRLSLPELATWLGERRITVTGMPTHLAQESLDFDWRGRSPRIITTGGSSLRGRPTDTTPFVLVNAYGPTETTVYVTTELVERGGDRAITIGRPIGGTQAYVLGPELQPVPSGIFGELWIGGANVSRGYLENPALTARKFVPDPFSTGRLYRTGDRARWRADGRLEFGGRIDDQVKLRGFRIELGEIESALASVGGVREGAVIGHPPPPGQQTPLPDGPPGPGDPGPARVPQERRRARVPAYMVPSAFVVLDALPRTAGGKLDRRALPSATVAPTSITPPRSPQEEAVAAVWRHVFQLDAIDIHADFHELGGHSLLAMKVVRAVQEQIGVEISLIDVLESPTIAKLTEWIEQIREQPAEVAAPAVYTHTDERTARATASQEYFYYLDRDDHDPSSYYSARLHVLEGPLDIDHFTRSYREVAAYHSIYRTAYRERGGVLEQTVRGLDEVAPFELSVVECPPSPDDSIESIASRTRAELTAQGYDLATGEGLLRARLVRVAPDRHVFVQLSHHIVADAQGTSAFERGLLSGYERLREGATTALAERPLQYIDYAVARERWHESPAGQAQNDFWKSHVRDARGAVLDGDVSRAALDKRRDVTPRGITADLSHPAEWRKLSPEVYARVIKVARDQHTGPNAVFLAALAYLLRERSGQDDIPIQTTYTRRLENPALDAVNGCLTTWSLALVDLAGVSEVSSAVSRAGDAISTILAHGAPHDYYGVVPHRLRRVVFNYLPTTQAQASEPEAPSNKLRTRVLAAGVPPWKRTWDLHLTLVDNGSSASLFWTGHSQLFRRETVVELLERFLGLLAEV